ncbi:MAG TPA: 5-dehydro-4-deoxy-D-glucuronate isomerase [Gemmatimonadaceae bacterium]|nr:5-dehydro-4-deoxy-D-glucuronate isomerase [Gemmatimonadaceae bacterium]
MALNVKVLSSPRPQDVQTLSTDALRSDFLVDGIFPGDGSIAITFTDLDRMAVGGVSPSGGPVTLENHKETGASFFLERRELGVINVGGPGVIKVDSKAYELGNTDCLYIATGSKSVTFESSDKGNRAKFYLLSCPSHAVFPTTLVKRSDATPIALGSQATANQRTIFQYIHQKGVKSSQLVMGFTELAEGSVWNTFPPHTHLRRTEIYFYFDMGQSVVSHFLGPPNASRHVWIKNEQAVLSPSWSIHCGCGTGAYKFIWAMAGENQTFDDMDKVAPGELR